MTDFDRTAHWQNIYANKQMNEVSWYQPTPATSLEFIAELNLPKTANIIDVGGGDSFLVDHLLELGYENISVLDISSNAIERAKKRLGERAENVTWIVADASAFHPTALYDVWHDRAAFHFLTESQGISNYVNTINKHIKPSGHLILGTFSETGPTKCSGIPIKQYSEQSMSDLLAPTFTKTQCHSVNHDTPFDTTQNFTFCCFQRLAL